MLSNIYGFIFPEYPFPFICSSRRTSTGKKKKKQLKSIPFQGYNCQQWFLLSNMYWVIKNATKSKVFE